MHGVKYALIICAVAKSEEVWSCLAGVCNYFLYTTEIVKVHPESSLRARD